MITISIIAIVLVLSIFSFIFLDQYFYKDYEHVYAFPPSNAPKTETSSISENKTTTYQFIKTWRTTPIEDISFDSFNNMYTISSYSLIQKFDSSGTFITKWGSFGERDGQFTYPNSIAIDSQDNVYVADSGNDRIQKFDSNGNFITKWGTNGTEAGKFLYPDNIAIDSENNVYVTDFDSNNIQKFDSNGTLITKWGSEGTEDGEFFSLTYIAVDSSTGNVYVPDDVVYVLDDNVYGTDDNNHSRIQVFAPVT